MAPYIKEEEVIGNGGIYHRPNCHTLRSYGQKMQSWKEAVAEGMRPCRVCYPFFSPRMEKVIGNNFTYHQLDCHILNNVKHYLLKDFPSWEKAVAEGMKPCEMCRPTFFLFKEEEVMSGKFMYHRLHCPLLEHIQRGNIERYQSWEEAEAKYKRPCELCRPSLILGEKPTPQIETPTNEMTSPIAIKTTKPTIPITDPERAVSIEQIIGWHLRLEQLIKELEQNPIGGLAGQIVKLTKQNVIPPRVATFMQTLNVMRNTVAHEFKPLSPDECSAVRTAWKVIEEWAQGQQLKL